MISLTRTAIRSILWASALAAMTALSPAIAQAASDIFAPGQPLVTGFPGVVALDEMPDGSDPLDYTFIDLDGYSLIIQQLLPDAPPEGQLIETASDFGVSAADVGLVSASRSMTHPRRPAPMRPISTSPPRRRSGFNIAMPDADGNPMRTRTGDPERRLHAGPVGQRPTARRGIRAASGRSTADRRGLAVHDHRRQQRPEPGRHRVRFAIAAVLRVGPRYRPHLPAGARRRDPRHVRSWRRRPAGA